MTTWESRSAPTDPRSSLGRTDPIGRILDGALAELASVGLHKLSMSDVSAEAGVARGTLYRYFATKSDLVDAIGDHLVAAFERALRSEADQISDGATVGDRVYLVSECLKQFIAEQPQLSRLADREPAFVRDLLRDNHPRLIEVITRALAPTRGQPSSPHAELFAELILRIGLSHHLMPSDASTLDTEVLGQVANTLDAQR